MADSDTKWPIKLKLGQFAKLTYGPNFKMDELLMLELDEDVLEEALDIGCVWNSCWKESTKLASNRNKKRYIE